MAIQSDHWLWPERSRGARLFTWSLLQPPSCRPVRAHRVLAGGTRMAPGLVIIPVPRAMPPPEAHCQPRTQPSRRSGWPADQRASPTGKGAREGKRSCLGLWVLRFSRITCNCAGRFRHSTSSPTCLFARRADSPCRTRRTDSVRASSTLAHAPHRPPRPGDSAANSSEPRHNPNRQPKARHRRTQRVVRGRVGSAPRSPWSRSSDDRCRGLRHSKGYDCGPSEHQSVDGSDRRALGGVRA